MRLKIEADMGYERCGMKIGGRDRDVLRFGGGIGNKTSIGGIIIKPKLRVTPGFRDIRKYYLL